MALKFIAEVMRPLFEAVALNAAAAAKESAGVVSLSQETQAAYLRTQAQRIDKLLADVEKLKERRAWIQELIDEDEHAGEGDI